MIIFYILTIVGLLLLVIRFSGEIIFAGTHYSKRYMAKHFKPTGCKCCDGYGYVLYPSFLGTAVYCPFCEVKSIDR